MSKSPNPFSYRYSSSIPEILFNSKLSLAITTYQAGKLVFLSPLDEDRLIQMLRTFISPMGLALKDNLMAVALKNELVVFASSSKLAKNYPEKPDVYDEMYTPINTHYTGECLLHDLFWFKDKLVGVNTLFSCLCHFEDDRHFSPFWQPSFISELAPQDRCHLNGVAISEDGNEIKYVSALGKSDEMGGWRENKIEGGILIDVETNEIVLSGLAMPHSPRLYRGKLYVLLSAKGELISVDVNKGTYEVVKHFSGFVRGMAFHEDYIFIGLSRLRKGRSFGDLPLAKEKKLVCGIAVVHEPTGAVVGSIEYDFSCEEIYDVQLMPNTLRPNILNTTTDIFRNALVIPGDAYWAVKKEEKKSEQK